MKKKFGKFLSILLTAVMLVGMLPATAFAFALAPAPTITITNGVATWNAIDGTYFYHWSLDDNTIGGRVYSDMERSFNLDKTLARYGKESGEYKFTLEAWSDDTTVISNTVIINYDYTTTHTHDWSEEWTTDDTHHWHECLNEGCGIGETLDYVKDGYGSHSFDGTACTVCGKEGSPAPEPALAPAPTITIEDGVASWNAIEGTDYYKWSIDDTIGGKVLSDMERNFKLDETLARYGKESGTYKFTLEARSDDSTPISEKATVSYIYTTTHTHNWAAEWTTDDTHHWHECLNAGCGIGSTLDYVKAGYGSHNFEGTACTVCGKGKVTTIDTIKITGITAPVAGKNPVTAGIATDTTGVTLKTIQWELPDGTIMTSSDEFEAGKTYTLYISYEPQSGYEISNTVTVTSDLENSNVDATSDRVNIQYTVPAAATYTVSVTDGKARQTDPVSDVYATTIETKAGNRVLLIADEKEGMVFTGWSGLDGIRLYGDGTTVAKATLEFFMPEKNVEVKANYIDESSDKVIKNIKITGITTPLAGASPEVGGITINTERVDYSRAAWNYNGAYLGVDDTFEKGKKYVLYVFLKLDEGYSVANDVTITADIDYDNAFVRDNVVYIYYTVKDEAPASYAVTVENDGNGTASATPTTAAADTTVTLTATPNEGYAFDKWEVVSGGATLADAAAATTTFTMPAGAVKVKATFKAKAGTPEPVKYKATVENGSGNGEYAAGAEVTITADSRSGYRFVKWTSDDVTVRNDKDETTAFFMPEKDVTVTAVYEKVSSGGSGGGGGSTKYKATVKDAENGSVTLSKTNAAKGTTVTLTVDPEVGYEVDEVTVVTKSGKEVEVTDKGDGTFTFTMPAEAVSTEVTFKETVNEETVSILLTIDSVIAWVFDEYVGNDVSPVIRNERTMLPARFVAEALGGVVTWDEAEQKVTIVNGEDTIEIFIGEPFATVNGDPVELDSPAFIENSRTYLPIRFIAENMGATVTWDADARTVKIVPGK